MRSRSVRTLVTVVAGFVALAGAGLVRLGVLRNRAELQARAQHLAVESDDGLARQLDEISVTLRAARRQMLRPGAVQEFEKVAASIISTSRHNLILFRVSNGRLVASFPDGSEAAQLLGLPFDGWNRSVASEPGGDGESITEGPIRMAGGQWAIVVRMPANGSTVPSEDWLAAARSVDNLIVSAGLDRLPGQGFDYQLSYRDPETGRVHPFLSSSNQTLDRPFERNLAMQQATWILAVAPRNGWFSWSAFLLHCGLVLILVLLAGVLTYDLAREPEHLRRELQKREHRLQTASHKLMQETQQRAEVEKQFSHASFHDALTGLPNRLYFMNRLERALRRARRQPKYQLAVIVLDIDRFKSINEALGHAAGDQLLVQVVQRLEGCLRPSDLMVARLGADELAFLLFDIQSVEAATIVAQRLQSALDAPFVLERQDVFVTASMGIAVSSMAFDSADELIRAADIALSKAKAEDRARYEVFDPAVRDQVLSLQQLETDLRRAIEKGELRLNFQPIVSLETSRIAGMEVLVRWQHPLEGMIPPSRFVPLAEETGLVVPLNRWVMRMACQQARAWREKLPDDVRFYLSVNLSARDLRQPDLCDFVAALLEETGLPRGTLRAEVTEGSMISNVKSASELVARLRAMGVPLLLDDFGTGYSSLSYLQLFKFDYLKIDQAFVRRVTPSGQNLGIIRAIVHIAEDLGIRTIAEGIESAEIAEHLRNLGCRYAQGYYFSKPVEADLAERLLESRRECPLAAEILATPFS